MHHTLVAGNIRGLRTNTVPDDLLGTFDSASSFNLIADAGTSGGLQHGVHGNIVGNGDGGTIDAETTLNTTLADNGEPTLTHALISGSLAIDAGDPTFDPGALNPPLVYNQRGEGFPRILGGRIDIGAFEFPSQQVETTTVVTSSANPSIYGDAVFFTATVSAATEAPTGTVQFLVSGSNLGAPVPLVNGAAASPVVSTLNAAAHTITAEYIPEPSSTFASSAGQLAGGQVVNPKALMATGITAADKVYDSTTEALLDVSGAAWVGRIGMDDVVLDTSDVAGAFEDPNVGSNKTVFVSGLVISGADAGNYSLIPRTTTASILAIDGFVLLARVRFVSTDGDQVLVDGVGRKIGPYDMQMVLADGQMELVGAGTVVPELGTSPETELWAVMYDIDDNDQIDFGDLSFFAAAFGRTVGAPDSEPPHVWWADFDKSGRVDFGDLAFFAPNFGKTRGDVQSGAQVLAATDAIFGQTGVVESERTPPWRRPQIATAGREFRLTDASQQPEPSVIRHSRNGAISTAPAERGLRWSDRWETLEDLLSVLAEQPSDRPLDDVPDF